MPATSAPFDTVFLGLEAEHQAAILAAPRQDRIQMLAELKRGSPDDLLNRLAQTCGLPVVRDFKLVAEPAKVIPLKLIHEYQCVPVEHDSARPGEVALVTVWPPDPVMDQWVYAICGRRPRWMLGPSMLIANTINQSFGVGSGSLGEGDMGGLADEADAEQSEDENAAIIRFVNEIIAKAITDRATDIHFEPGKDSLHIRYRIDGELVPVRVPDNLVNFQSAIISRIKIMARLNISERRRPQDGRITFSGGEEEIDIRISTLPTLYGESVSLRLLSQRTQPITIEELGFMPDDVRVITPALKRPHGIILVTGPTGSGKSTSLTSFIRRIRTPQRRIITVEDPVEYEVPGVNQTQVHAEIGLTFANALRHVLRQDPDVIMVGEIRDRETAEIAIRASLTGHLVLSTLHTNDAPGAISRLIDMDIEPFLIASSVEMIIAQRLVRRLCPVCARPADPDVVYLGSCLVALGLDPSEVSNGHLLKEPAGCDSCRRLGFRGRVGIFEILPVTEDIHDLIIQKASARDIRQRALSKGMRTLQASGWEQVKRGLTALAEIMRYSATAEEYE